MNLAGKAFLRLTPDHVIKPFDCAKSDLNNYLFSAAKPHQAELLSVTYILEDETNTIAFFSLLNDRIGIEDFDSNRQYYKRIMDKMIYGKKYRSYPAMKIGRLAVNKCVHRQGIGEKIIGYLKIWFVDNNKTGCKFITVDALNDEDSIAFYLKHGFVFLTEKDKDKDERQMYYDLTDIANEVNKTVQN